MTTIIAGQKLTVSPELKAFITQKVETRLEVYAPRIHKVNVTVSQEHVVYKAECTVTSDFGDFHAIGDFESAEASVDRAVDNVFAEIRKKHDKIIDKKHIK